MGRCSKIVDSSPVTRGMVSGACRFQADESTPSRGSRRGGGLNRALHHYLVLSITKCPPLIEWVTLIGSDSSDGTTDLAARCCKLNDSQSISRRILVQGAPAQAGARGAPLVTREGVHNLKPHSHSETVLYDRYLTSRAHRVTPDGDAFAITSSQGSRVSTTRF